MITVRAVAAEHRATVAPVKVLVVTSPGAGHVFPMVPLAWALRSAGHDLLVASSARRAGRGSGVWTGRPPQTEPLAGRSLIIMSGRHDRGLTAGRRLAVLRALRRAPGPLSISDIAGQLSVHPNTVRFHLATLVENGQVEQVEADRRPERVTGRPPLRFRPVLGMDPTGPRQFQLLAELLGDGLANAPGGSAQAVEAGRAWGRRRAAASSEGEAATADGSGDSVPRLMGLLAEIGFAPEQRGDGAPRRIGLRHCPFLELAQARSAIVCPVHLGLMQGALEAWRSPVAVDRLEPFVEPDLCLAHLTTGGAS